MATPPTGHEETRLSERAEELTRVIGAKYDELVAERRAAEAERDQAVQALVAASEDARILVQDYYSGLPEHRAPVDGAVARLAHLFEHDDEDCSPRTAAEIVTDGMTARATLDSAWIPPHLRAALSSGLPEQTT